MFFPYSYPMSVNTPFNEKKYLTDDECDHLVRVLRTYHKPDRPMDFRDTTMLFILLYTGMRVTEFLRLRPVDILTDSHSIQVTGLKNGNDRQIPLQPWLFRALVFFAKMQPDPFGFIFDIKYNRLRTIWFKYRPVKKKVHALRHTFAVRNYKNTKDVRLIMNALGHKNLTTTQIYQNFVYSQEEMRKLLSY